MSPPFVVVGESLVDVVVPVAGGSLAAGSFRAAGGSPMNVAIGLARLDVATELVTELGDDEPGSFVGDHLRASGVLVPASCFRPGRATSTATARTGSDGVAVYDFDLTWDLPMQRLPADVVGLHVGSLGTVVRPGRAAVLDLVRQAVARDVFVSYDPNVRPAFVPDPSAAWRELCALAASARLVKVSDEDLHALRPDADVRALVRGLLGDTTELVLVTHGAHGASAFTRDRALRAPAPSIGLVDTVGAGDSFMAAALAGLVGWGITNAGPGALSALDDDRMRTLLDSAMAAAAVTCSRRGADPPTRRELGPAWPGRLPRG